MFSKYSVKKPMTVFVAVIIVLVLGVVSFMSMTPDLLPNMEFPYAIIMTTYGGQTPETVEETVSKPLEKSLSTIDGVKEITSTSAENYSLVMIEFEDGTDMDTATVDMRSSLDTISDAWPDGVGTPYLMKVNPNIMPVSMVAVDYEGMEKQEISDYVSNELINELEGIDGVASVSDKGIITEQENVVISQEKVDRLNKKISAALDDQFGEAEDKLNDAQKQLDDNISQAEEGAGTISSSIEEINAQQQQLADELEKAQNEAQNGNTTIINTKMQLLDQKSSLTSTKQTLETTYQALISVKTALDELEQKKDSATQTFNELTGFNDLYDSIAEQMKAFDENSEEYKQLQEQLNDLNKQLEEYGITTDGLNEALSSAKSTVDMINTSISELGATLTELGTIPEELDGYLDEITQNIAQIDAGIAELDKAIEGLDDKSVTVNQALSTISKQQSSANFKLSSALTTLTTKQSELNSALTQLDSAQKEIDSSMEELNSKKKEAKSKADMKNSVTVDNVSQILTAQNFSMPAGYVTDDDNNKYMVRVGDEVADEKELGSLVLFDTGIDGIGVVKLSDVADVFLVDDSDEVYAKVNGNAGIVLSFSKQSNTSTSEVCDNISEKLDQLSQENEGLNFTNLYSQGDYINIVIDNVLQNLVLGAIFAIIILFIFLRDIKPTIIVACSIPISVVFAIVLMYFSGVTLNMISLSGLAIGVGMLVDNSVVVIENIYRLRARGVSAIKAAVSGAKQVAGAITSSTLTTICVFLPIVFVDGITRQLFVDLALTIAYSLLASLIVALTLVPAMSQRMLRNIKTSAHENKDGKIKRAYEKSLRFVLNHRAISLIVVAALLVASVGVEMTRGFSFMPEMSSTELAVTVSLDDNATFEETVDAAEQLNDALNKHEEFETVGVMVGGMSSLMGLSAGGSSSDAGSVIAYAVLKDDYTKQSDQLSKDIQSELADIDGEVSVSGGSSSMTSILGDDGVAITIYGDDLDKLQSTAKDMAKELETIDGIDEVSDGIGATSPEIRVTVDKSKAVKKGLTVAQVYQQVASKITDEKTSTTLTNANGDDIDVVIIKDESEKVNADNVGSIELTYTDKEGNEKTTTLSSVAEISEAESMNAIARDNQKRYIQVSGTLKDGYTTTSVANAVKKHFNDYELPSGFSIEYSGSDETTMEAVYELLKMLLLGVILIYLIMVAQFQSLKSPFIIMFTILLAFTGGFIGLFITGFDISVVSLVGFIMLCGIIVNNGIVLVDYVNQLRVSGMERREALVEAGKTRMRPILITALTTVFGLLPTAVGIGTGAEMMQPIAIVCIGGLLYATFMTLYIVPVIYDLFCKKPPRKVDEKELSSIDEDAAIV